MKAQRGLPPPLLDQCCQVPVGTCLCGRAAMTRQIVFASHVDERHEVITPAFVPTGTTAFRWFPPVKSSA